LRAAGGLEVWDSAGGRGLIEAAGAGKAGVRASYSNASFSWSRDRRKLEEAIIDELE
jgi:3'-phosphoadenosine 5'-phosphosulfate (PAPS) 3'-phosphatase